MMRTHLLPTPSPLAWQLRATKSHDVDRNGLTATRLCTHVADAAAINKRRLVALPGATTTCRARDDVGNDSAMLRLLNGACRAPAVVSLQEIGA